MHVEILSPEERVLFFGADGDIRGAGDYPGAAQDPMHLVRVRQTSTGTDIPILLTTTPIAPLRRCCHANSYVRSRDMGYNERTQKMLRTAQHSMLRLVFQTKRKYKQTSKETEKKSFATMT